MDFDVNINNHSFNTFAGSAQLVPSIPSWPHLFHYTFSTILPHPLASPSPTLSLPLSHPPLLPSLSLSPAANPKCWGGRLRLLEQRSRLCCSAAGRQPGRGRAIRRQFRF